MMVSPDAEAMDLAAETKEHTHRRYYDAFHNWFTESNCDFWSECDAPESLASIAVEINDAALTAATMREREAATIRAIEFVEGGRFLHDDAPPKRFAMECATQMRRQLLEPIRARSIQEPTK